MQRTQMSAVVFVAVLGAVLSLANASPAVAQETATPPPDWGVRIAELNEKAEFRLQETARVWRGKFAAIGRKDRFHGMVSHAISIEGKLTQGVDLLTSQRADRMREYLRQQVVDERQLARSMAQAFADLQQELLQESIALYVQAGVKRDTAAKVYPTWMVDQTPWLRAFDPLLNRAKSMANQDWIRFGAITVGSSIASDLVRDAGREAGIYQPPNRFADFLGGLVIEMAVEAAADAITDPTEGYATKLQADFQAAQRQVLEGPNGLLACLRKVTSLHQQTRLHHFGLLKKEVQE